MTNKINLNLTRIDRLPSPQQFLDELPLLAPQEKFIDTSRKAITQILSGQDPRLLLITGPCSIHDFDSAKEYALKLKALSMQVSDSFLIVMRAYFEKPRTSTGWKGLLYDPYLDGTNSISHGLRMTRQLLLELAKLEIPVASELLEPLSCYYLSDLISWVCVGARTAESQVHRQMASGLSMPVAFKNTTSGNIGIAVNAIIAAGIPHSFIGLNSDGQAAAVHTSGNPHCHLVLRGGEQRSNYDPASISSAVEKLEKHRLSPKIIIDCSHDNSRNNHEQQPVVFEAVLQQIIQGERAIRGMILESHLNAGNQSIPKDRSKLRYAVSLTDSCLDWASTERLILSAHQLFNKEKQSLNQFQFCQR
jgi:3-deoxy-7-phosphoheptulonate synthase